MDTDRALTTVWVDDKGTCWAVEEVCETLDDNPRKKWLLKDNEKWGTSIAPHPWYTVRIMIPRELPREVYVGEPCDMRYILPADKFAELEEASVEQAVRAWDAMDEPFHKLFPALRDAMADYRADLAPDHHPSMELPKPEDANLVAPHIDESLFEARVSEREDM